MGDYIEKIIKFNNVELILFMEELLFNSDKIVKEYFFMSLQNVALRHKKMFLDRISTSQAKFMEQQIANQRQLEAGEIEKAEPRFKEIVDNMESLYSKALESNKEGHELALNFREILKASDDYKFSDQNLGKPFPPAFKSLPENGEIIELPKPSADMLIDTEIFQLISNRKSHRNYNDEKLTIEELSWLLWATQGVKKMVQDGKAVFRTVPSGGARHPFETYLAVNRVEGLFPGIYRFVSEKHKLLLIERNNDLSETMNDIAQGQTFVGSSAVCFIWAVLPYRTEWRYSNQAKKDILIEAGHICQNLYLATEAIRCGTCGIAAYQQEKVDELLNLDGKDEFVVYIAPVGRIKT